MSLGERIVQLRKAQNISQGQLAQALGVSRQAVSKWENDLSHPDSGNLIQLCDLLDTDMEYLTAGRYSYGRRPPVVVKTVETVETVVEKPIVQVVEKIVERVVEKPVVEFVEKPKIQKVIRVKYRTDPVQILLVGAACFAVGMLIGLLL